MFLKRNNVVTVDFLEQGKESKNGIVIGFDSNFVIMQFENNDFETLVPYSNISEIRAIMPKKPTENMINRTQL